MTDPIAIGGMAWYMREDYAAARSIMKDGHLMPASFDRWLENAENGERELQGRGYRVIRVVIDPKAFPEWCRARGLNVDAKARAAFANEHVARDAGVIG